MRAADGDEMIGLDELTAEALAADPETPLDADAEPFTDGAPRRGLLPEWYMPMPASTRRTRPRMLMVGALVAALVVVNGAGLCVTYGFPEIAW